MIERAMLLLALFWVGQLSARTGYNGPNQLGPVRIDREQPIRKLVKEIGLPASKSQPYCFESQNARRFLWIDSPHDQSWLGTVLLSDFPNCVNRPIGIAANDLAQWKTEHGVGVGSTEGDVRKAYGPPTRVDKWSQQDTWRLFKGRRYDRRPAINTGNRKLVYYDTSDDTLRLAEFGIREGIVCWILLSQDE